ncbi:MAG: class I SAM-dependent methyltransferase [Deltaproteobacteria bacterium]|nr:class I SAM-dependent methyltransferase [Deltaproteobacteria bacterium]
MNHRNASFISSGACVLVTALGTGCAAPGKVPAAAPAAPHAHGAAHESPTPDVGHHHGHGMPHRFEDAAAWSKQFDASERDAWQQPDALIRALALPADALVADVGAGTGYFAVRLARALPAGRVVGLDVEADMVRFMTERAAKDGLSNLVARVTPATSAALDPNTDVVLVVNTYHHLTERVAYFRDVAAKLSPRGRVVIVDFRLESHRGPPREYKLPPERVAAELAEAGMTEVNRWEFLPDQYVLAFAPAGRTAAGAR